MSQKMGFWSVFAIVTGCQIGSSVFIAPTTLVGYGSFALIGFLISGVGAMALCHVFAFLCTRYPRTGGPHVYIKEIFGDAPAFFTGWTYWVISWISTTVVIVTTIGYLVPIIGEHSKNFYLLCQIILLVIITLLNFKGVKIAGYVEFWLTVLKFIPLIILPIVALFFFKADHFVLDQTIALTTSTPQILAQVTLLTLWGFIGFESATAPAESVEDPEKTIPRAMIFGTLCVIVIYLINCLGILGLVPPEVLKTSKAPYVDATQMLFGGKWYILISLVAAVVCIGTINAWVLTSGQIAFGLAKDKLMPAIFMKQNSNQAPVFSILISSIGIVPLLLMTVNDNFAVQIRNIIDISVTSFLFVYIFCCLGHLILSYRERKTWSLLIGLVAVCFCGWIICETTITTLGISSIFTLSGIPMYLFWFRRNIGSQPILE